MYVNVLFFLIVHHNEVAILSRLYNYTLGRPVQARAFLNSPGSIKPGSHNQRHNAKSFYNSSQVRSQGGDMGVRTPPPLAQNFR